MNPITHFPVVVEHIFTPTDVDQDGEDLRWDGKPCPCQEPPYTPKFGGGFNAKRGSAFHRALDIMAPEGALIVAPFDAWVPAKVHIRMDGKWGYYPGSGTGEKAGNYVFLENDICRFYVSHMSSSALVRPGEDVEAGTGIGFVGRTGNAVRKYKSKSGTIYRGCPHAHVAITSLSAKFSRWCRSQGIAVVGNKVDPVPLLRASYEALYG